MNNRKCLNPNQNFQEISKKLEWLVLSIIIIFRCIWFSFLWSRKWIEQDLYHLMSQVITNRNWKNAIFMPLSKSKLSFRMTWILVRQTYLICKKIYYHAGNIHITVCFKIFIWPGTCHIYFLNITLLSNLLCNISKFYILLLVHPNY